MAGSLKMKIFENDDKYHPTTYNNTLRINIDEVKNIFKNLKEFQDEQFIGLNYNLKIKYEKLVKIISLMMNSGFHDQLIKLKNDFFGEENVKPGTLGSYLYNCISEKKLEENNEKEEYELEKVREEIENNEKYSSVSIFYYSGGFFVPIRITDSETCILLVDNEKYPDFVDLSPDQRIRLNDLGKKKFKIINEKNQEIYSEWNDRQNQLSMESRENSKGRTLIFMVVALIIFVGLFLFWMSYKNKKLAI